MKRPSKKDIKAMVDKLKAPEKSADIPEAASGTPQPQKSSKRIRKQGV